MTIRMKQLWKLLPGLLPALLLAQPPAEPPPPPEPRGPGMGQMSPGKSPPPVRRYMESLRESDPGEYERLEKLKQEDPRAFRMELRKNAWEKREGKHRNGPTRPHPLESEIRKVREAESPEARLAAIEELRGKVRERVEENLREREAAIEKFRQQLKALEEQNQQERIRREEIIDHHLERILKNLGNPPEDE